jgi:hypothetical protein
MKRMSILISFLKFWHLLKSLQFQTIGKKTVLDFIIIEIIFLLIGFWVFDSGVRCEYSL